MRSFVMPCLLLLSFLSGSLKAGEIIYFPNNLFPYSGITSLLGGGSDFSFDGGRVSSPPKEYFSINTVYLRNKYLIHMGKDMINGNYVVMPSPNVLSVESRPNNKKKVTIQQYYPDLESKLMEVFGLTPSQIHYLYIA